MNKIEELVNLKYDLLISNITLDNEDYVTISYPELPGLTIYAETLEEGLLEIEEAKKEWFYAALESGAEIPKPNKEKLTSEASGRVTLRLPKSLHAEVKIKAEAEGSSLNTYLNFLISSGLRQTSVESAIGDVANSIEGTVTNLCNTVVQAVSHISNKSNLAIASLMEDKPKEEYHFHFSDNKPDVIYNVEKISEATRSKHNGFSDINKLEFRI